MTQSSNHPRHSAPADDSTPRSGSDPAPQPEGDKETIDRELAELHVSTTASGKDQSQKPDTEGSSSSSKNLDDQDD
jgi:hypothetical protein